MAGKLQLDSAGTTFFFAAGDGFKPGQEYPVLQAPDLAAFQASQFSANKLGAAEPSFRIDGDTLIVSYGNAEGSA